MNLLGHRLGDLALGIAAVNDALLWLLLGAIMAVFAGEGSGTYGSDRQPVRYAGLSDRHVPVSASLPAAHRPSCCCATGAMSERALAAVCGVALGSAIATPAARAALRIRRLHRRRGDAERAAPHHSRPPATGGDRGPDAVLFHDDRAAHADRLPFAGISACDAGRDRDRGVRQDRRHDAGGAADRRKLGRLPSRSARWFSRAG